MFSSQKMPINQNNPNISTTTQILNISNNKEKNLSLFSKNINFEYRVFGNDITNIALTAFEKGNIVPNKSILKAINLIRSNIKNKERSREKSLIKNRKHSSLRNTKNKKDVKRRPNWKIRMGEDFERKKSRLERKKNDTNKNKLIIMNSKTNSTNSISENENNINISEFNIDNNRLNNSFFYKKEEKSKNEFISKITEVNINIDQENIPLRYQNHQILKKNSKVREINSKYDLQYVKEYQEEIIEYLLSLEQEKRINPNYMKEQKDINDKMRIILIDWLIEVHLKFKLLPETLFLTINFIDRYLQKNQTTRDKLQLIAVSSLLIACKYEEIYPPEISSFVYITDNAYKKEDILNYELKILSSLDYDVTYPTPFRYLEILIVKLGLVDDEIFFYKMQYLLELSLSKLVFYNYTYLELVISCCLFLFENDYNMTQNIIICFELNNKQEKLNKIKNCIYEIKKILEYISENKSAFKGLRQKFAMEKFGCISKIQFL